MVGGLPTNMGEYNFGCVSGYTLRLWATSDID